MLSRPYGSCMLVPGLMFLSKNAFKDSVLFEVFSESLKYLVRTMWSSPYFYQIPSHPTSSSSSCPFRATSMMSGMQVIGCWLKGSPGTVL